MSHPQGGYPLGFRSQGHRSTRPPDVLRPSRVHRPVSDIPRPGAARAADVFTARPEPANVTRSGADPTGQASDDDPAQPGLSDRLRAGAALFNAGHHLAAHDPWEAAWLPLESGPDERLFHGLIQTAAATHHAPDNVEGATTLATGARDYLDGLDGHRGVALAPVHDWLDALAADPGVVRERNPPELRVGGVVVTPGDLEFPAASVAAPHLAAARGEDAAADLLERAAAFGRADLADGETTSPFVTLVLEVLDPERPDAMPLSRLRDHVQRREQRVQDVSGLFETDGE